MTKYREVLEELLEYIEENNICDENEILWLTDEDCTIDSNRSQEFTEIIEKAKLILDK